MFLEGEKQVINKNKIFFVKILQKIRLTAKVKIFPELNISINVNIKKYFFIK